MNTVGLVEQAYKPGVKVAQLLSTSAAREYGVKVGDVITAIDGEALPAATRAWKFGMDKVYLPFYRAFMVRDRARFEERARRVIAWEFDSLLPCHGTFVDGRGKRALREHLSGENG